MTALTRYERLEAPGLWRDAPGAQRREVIVQLGDNSLAFADPRTGRALAHWSLPAVRPLSRSGTRPALFAPAEDGYESLELEDEVMIEALSLVAGAIDRAMPHPGRLRRRLTLGLTTALLAALVLWGPGRLRAYTLAVLPEAARAELGRAALSELQPLTGAPCAAPLGRAALARLTTRLLGPGPAWEVAILPDGVKLAAPLPGRIIFASKDLVETAPGPEALAGAILAAAMAAGQEDPLAPLLRSAGLGATYGLLTSDHLPQGALTAYGPVLLAAPPPDLPPEALLARFAAAGVPSSPYAYARDPSGESVLTLIEGDPFEGRAPAPLMPPADWAALQRICAAP